MLLGSPPDMVRGHPLRETGSAASHGGLSLLFYYILSQIATENFPVPKKAKKSYLFGERGWIGEGIFYLVTGILTECKLVRPESGRASSPSILRLA